METAPTPPLLRPDDPPRADSPVSPLSEPRPLGGPAHIFRSIRRLLQQATERRPALLAACAAALAYLPFLSAGPIRGAIEGNRLEAAREMLLSGDWVVPTLNGAPYLAKPPGHYWLIAAFSAPFGEVSVFSGRVVSALCVIAMVAAVARWCARNLGARVAFPAAFTLLASGVLLEKGALAEMEAPLALFTALALFSLHDSVVAAKGGMPRAVLAGLLLGVAVLIKGPVAPLFFALATVALAWGARPRGRALLRGLVALLVAILVAAPWTLLLVERVGIDEVARTLDQEVTARVGRAGATNHEPFYYYLYALPMALGPVALVLPAAVSGARDLRARNRVAFAMLIAWSVGALLALSLSSGKEMRYLLSTLAAWAILIANGLLRGREPWLRRYLRGLSAGAGWALATAPAALAIGGWIGFPHGHAGVLAGALIVLAACSAGVIGVRRHSGPTAFLALGLLLFGMRVFAGKGYLHERDVEFPLREIGRTADTTAPRGEPVLYAGRYAAEVHFALAHPVIHAPDGEALRRALAAPGARDARLVLTHRLDVPAELRADWQPLASWEKGSTRIALYRRF